MARVVRLEVNVDDSHVATWIADGLVVSSPTGSTGYSFSAGGPILDPTSRNLVVTSIAAYLSAVRTFVVSPAHGVNIRVLDAFDCMVSIDGREDDATACGRRGAGVRPTSSPSASSSRAARCRSGSCCDARPSCCPPEMALLELSVTDLALLERARVGLGSGLTVITGETGAGKSLLIDALTLVAGGRADASLRACGGGNGAGRGALRPAGGCRGRPGRAAHLRP